MTTLRLILGDQLNPRHSWFSQVDDSIVHVCMEMRQETDYVLHHAQKILAIFAGMRAFAAALVAAGHRVHYLHIGDADNRQQLTANLDWLITQHGAAGLAFQAPDEWRLDAQLDAYAKSLKARGVAVEKVDSEHFYTRRAALAELFQGQKSWLMERFYRDMRQQHRVLITTGNKPVGGQWNFDHDNRQRWQGQPATLHDQRPCHDHRALWAEIEAAGIKSFGNPQAENFRWPLDRPEALQQFEHFLHHALPHFGQFQDAMSSQCWRLFHALISFALNTKMLGPQEVVMATEAAWHAGDIPLPAAEGFIRQILGWREYVRGVYWAQMPGYEQRNHFDHRQALPGWFWTGKTHMRCVHHAIGQSLEHAYAHHIQRLMVIGNFALLAGIDPQQLHEWYLGIYIDAFEWVELPNTLGMSQFADGGQLATKPYVSSAAYIDRMSDYCKGCRYDKKLRTGPKACPFNALYWDFHARHADKLAKNPRIGMVYRQLEKMAPEAKEAIALQAEQIRGRLDTL
ncbi:MAG: cryptochrome/photolyase family protein [Pseudomonadota bacterium]